MDLFQKNNYQKEHIRIERIESSILICIESEYHIQVIGFGKESSKNINDINFEDEFNKIYTLTFPNISSNKINVDNTFQGFTKIRDLEREKREKSFYFLLFSNAVLFFSKTSTQDFSLRKCNNFFEVDDYLNQYINRHIGYMKWKDDDIRKINENKGVSVITQVDFSLDEVLQGLEKLENKYKKNYVAIKLLDSEALYSPTVRRTPNGKKSLFGPSKKIENIERFFITISYDLQLVGSKKYLDIIITLNKIKDKLTEITIEENTVNYRKNVFAKERIESFLEQISKVLSNIEFGLPTRPLICNYCDNYVDEDGGCGCTNK